MLLSPLPDRLREQSATNLRGGRAGHPARAVEDALRERDENQFALQGVAEELRQRTDGRVLVDDPVLPGDVLYDTSTGASIRGAALTSLHTQRTRIDARPTSRATSSGSACGCSATRAASSACSSSSGA